MLMLKLTFSSSVTRGVGSIKGMVSNQADTYMIGADKNVLITIPDVTYTKKEQTRHKHCFSIFWMEHKSQSHNLAQTKCNLSIQV